MASKKEKNIEADAVAVKDDDADDHHKKEIPQKRKNASKDNEPQKEPRRSTRGAAKPEASPSQVVQYLLSPAAKDIATPKDEKDALADHKDMRTYSGSIFTPFEELLCAVILSRPISHMLGLRTIRTIFNDPYNFSSPKTIQEAGEEMVKEAIYQAKTQHKQKTADELSQIANVMIEKFEGDIENVREQGHHDVDEERQLLKDSIKGLGDTGLNIFFRRVQWLWPKAFPFVDDRTAKSLHALGLPEDGTELNKLLEKHWKSLNESGMEKRSEDERRRRAFVVLLERAIGADLEKQLDTVVTEAAKV